MKLQTKHKTQNKQIIYIKAILGLYITRITKKRFF